MSIVFVFGMRLLEVLFFVGIAGSAVVVAIATWEDMQELFRKEDEHVIGKTPST